MSNEPIDNQALQPIYAEPSRKIRPQKYIAVLRQKWWILLITLSLTIGAAIAYLATRPTNFRSQATMWVGGKMRVGDVAQYSEDLLTFYGTQIELISSATIAERALRQMNNAVTNFVASRDAEGNLIIPKLSVVQAPKSAVFGLSAVHTNAVYAKDYLQAVMEAFLAYKKDVRSGTSGSALESVSKQVEKTERDLKKDQLLLADFQKNNNIALYQEQAMGGGNHLAQLNAQLTTHKLELQLMDAAALEKSIGAGGQSNLLDSAELSRFASATTKNDALPSSFLTAKQQVQVLKIQKEQLGRYLRPKHPKMLKLDEEVARGEQVLEFFKKQNENELNIAKQALKLRIESVESTIKVLEGRVGEATLKLSEYERIRNDVQRQQSLYDRLLALFQSVDINTTMDQENLSILQPASIGFPANKSPILVLAAAIFLGFMGGIGLLFLLAVTDDRCNSLEEVRDNFNEEIIGQIPDVRSKKKGVIPWFRLDGENHIFVESCKNLRSSLIYRANDGTKPKTILVTSAAPDEGKSTVAVNLARTLAFGGAKVLLVDGDLRRGSLHHLMGLPAGPGLTDMLNEDPAALATRQNPYVQATEIPNLQFIARGKDDFNGSELFLKPAFDAFLEDMRERYDCVILDSCPVFAADDATTVAPKMDGVLFVFRRGHTKSALAQMALELLYQRQSKIMGIVFNRADSNSHSYRYYKYAKYARQAKKA